ncbi:Fc receptor 2 isoform X4 [Labeo rohita]|uniref:Fc receptor 2 isoform X4 n=1 Tax=Labeo rohita TaxID=84645 RepID=A0A498NYB8_LABRO|nr:Fc receptor 2 isoform X4 [Labeo rohita]
MAAPSSSLLVTGVVVGLSVFLLIFISLVLLWRYKKNKASYSPVPERHHTLMLRAFLKTPYVISASGSDHIYDVLIEVNKRQKDDPESYSEVTYSEVTYSEVTAKKYLTNLSIKMVPWSNYVTYSEVITEVKKCKSKDQNGS